MTEETKKLKNCPYCNGNGLDADDDDESKTTARRKCPQCKGSGSLKDIPYQLR